VISVTPRPRAALARVPVHTALTLALALIVATVAACAGTKPASPAPTPAGSAAVEAPGPSPTPWPQNVVESVLALGAADAELWKAGADIAKAADAKDVEAMWGAADGTVKLIEAMMPNVEILEGYPHTADLGAKYRASFTVMLEGATQLRDSITAGDAAGVVAGSKRLGEGITLYGDVRAILQAYVDEAIPMKKNLTQ
jgi:hypothetical protein